MDGDRASDSPIVSTKPSNNGSGAPELAEGVERRGLATGNLVTHHRGRTQGRGTLSQAHDWVRQALRACAFDPRQEPSAVVLHAGICAGGGRVTGIPTATACPKQYFQNLRSGKMQQDTSPQEKA